MSRDALVVGGGPAGAGVAIGLAQAGAEVTLLERQAVTGDALCGGFMSWQTLDQLAALGIDVADLDGHCVTRLQLFAGDARAVAPLPRAGMGLSRHRLDTLLLDRTAAAGVTIERGVKVRALNPDTSLDMGDGSTRRATSVFLATGKHALRGAERVMPARLAGDPVLGLRLRIPVSQAITALVGDSIELHLFDRGYAGLLCQEDGSANLCLAVHKSRLDAARQSPAALLAQLGEQNPALGERVALADMSANIDAIAAVPYGWRTATTAPGLFRLGDQAGVIPSLAGEGMGIALASAALAVRHWQAGGAAAAAAFQRDLARRLRHPLGLAGLLWRGGENARLAPALTRLLAIMPGAAAMLARGTRIDGG